MFSSFFRFNFFSVQSFISLIFVCKIVFHANTLVYFQIEIDMIYYTWLYVWLNLVIRLTVVFWHCWSIDISLPTLIYFFRLFLTLVTIDLEILVRRLRLTYLVITFTIMIYFDLFATTNECSIMCVYFKEYKRTRGQITISLLF